MMQIQSDSCPLYCRAFYIEDTTLAFPNLNDDNPIVVQLMEKVILTIREHVLGNVTFPSKEEMMEAYN